MDPGAAPPATLGDRLALARRSRLVGRAAELAHFDRMLAGEAAPVWVLHGPGGIGKTTLLAELARRADATGRVVVELDARHLSATPEGWRAALAAALGPGTEAPPPGAVLLVDTFETLAGLDGWLRETELPRWPADGLVVLAGRSPAAADWRLDPGWSSLAEVSRLPPWTAAEARAYLAARLGLADVPEDLVAQAGGVPLMAAILAEAWRRQGGPPGDAPQGASADPDLRAALLRDLLDRFARDLTDPARRGALEVLTVARGVTLPMLTELLGPEAAALALDWAAGLPFVQETEAGLQLHDLVREALAENWRTRAPEALPRVAQRVQQHLARRAPLVPRAEAERHLKDWVFTLRFTDAAGLSDHRHAEDHVLAPLGGDGAAVLALVRARLGEGMEARIAHWLAEAPQSFHLVRKRDGALQGVILVLEMTALDPGVMAADPAVARAWAHVQRIRPPGPGGSAACLRLTLDADADDLPNPTATLAGLWLTRRTLLDRRAEWNVAFHHNGAVMAGVWPRLSRLNWARAAPELDDIVDGHRHAAFLRDYVADPVSEDWRPPDPGAGPPLPGPDAFAEAVREALRQFGRDAALADSPLMRCAVLGGGATPAALRAALEAAVAALAVHPADRKFHEALRLTWLVPGAKQEAVAAELGLPFNTYRYRLTRGTERVARLMWQREVAARQG